jgi:hypothetical protein
MAGCATRCFRAGGVDGPMMMAHQAVLGNRGMFHVHESHRTVEVLHGIALPFEDVTVQHFATIEHVLNGGSVLSEPLLEIGQVFQPARFLGIDRA